MNNEEYSFTELELDALGELMNISFGSAAADLAEVLDIFINLNVPSIKLIKKSELPAFINSELPGCHDFSMIEQKYHGDFGGIALLIFPYGMEKELLSYFSSPDGSGSESIGIAGLEKEVLMEIGNILIGACIGKIFELLDSHIVYFPPTAVIGKGISELMKEDQDDSDDISITLKTRFSFEDRKVEGHLFMINNKESIHKLKNALKPFTGIE